MDPTSAGSLALIVIVAVVAPLLAELLRRFRIPGVVLEIGLGILIGQQVLGLATVTPTIEVFGDLGLCFLMFLAGFEIDLTRIAGRPLSRATLGWFVSLAMAVVSAGVLVVTGFALSDLLIALCLTTTALGTLLPMLRDQGVADTPFGGHILAVGTVGEFLPIVAIALLLTSDNPGRTALLLVAFIVLAVGATLLATRPKPPKVVEVLRKHLNSSAQLPVRIAVLMIVALVWIAAHLGLDVLLGAFTAGIIVRLFTHGDDDEEVVTSKIEALGFGFFVPVFFVVSGMNFDLDALFASATTVLRVPLFLALFLVVRGLPVLLLYRQDLPRRDRASLALFSATALPLVVVITGIGLDTGRMRPENAAALVGAALLSVLIFPLAAFAFHRRGGGPVPVVTEGDEPAPAPR
jgi:Kef-type K+ transport system membrane component KefB